MRYCSQRPQFGRRHEPIQVVIASGSNIRSFCIRPWLAAAFTVFAIVFSVTYLAATSYLVFRDDLITFVDQRTDRMRSDYERRIAYLRSQVDKMTSSQLVSQETLETQIEVMRRRQEELTSRHEVIASVLDLARLTGLDLGMPLQPPPAKPDQAALSAPPNQAVQSSRQQPLDAVSANPIKPQAALDLRGFDLEPQAIRVDQMAFETSVALDAVRAVAEARTRKIHNTLKAAGLPVSGSDAEEGGLGGPFIPLSEVDAAEFSVRAERTRQALQTYLKVKASLRNLPIANPVPGASISSGYGQRMDPFLKRRALHSGIDYRSPRGRPVLATANGYVTAAGRNGGYGKMVEIRHANGLSTRYAHMSKIRVTKGQRVARGTVIGNVGSSGRSTGPHLHYEVREGKRPTNPRPFLRAGKKIRSLIR